MQSVMSKLTIGDAGGNAEHSEQSLLLKSSSASEKSNSDNTINRMDTVVNNAEDGVNIAVLSSSESAEGSGKPGNVGGNNEAKQLEQILVDEAEASKIYEETEI
jgi:hypothetical protein